MKAIEIKEKINTEERLATITRIVIKACENDDDYVTADILIGAVERTFINLGLATADDVYLFSERFEM